jgi:hypothetical protein
MVSLLNDKLNFVTSADGFFVILHSMYFQTGLEGGITKISWPTCPYDLLRTAPHS